jgi:hypothetical protein
LSSSYVVPSVAVVSGLVSVVFFVLFVFIICRTQCCLCIWSLLCILFYLSSSYVVPSVAVVSGSFIFDTFGFL